MVERNIIMGKLGVTQDDKSVLVSFDDGKIIIEKKANA